MAAQARKSTQRERLVAGMVEATNRHGYAGANVSAVIGAAGVSRPTFYDYFEDRDDCFRATIEDTQEQLLARVQSEIEGAGAAEAPSAAIAALVTFALDEPARARFLMGEALAGGAGALDARDAGIAKLAAAIEAAQRRPPRGALLPDLPAAIVVATAYRMLATRLRRVEGVSSLADDLSLWAAAYARPAHGRRFAKLAPGPLPAPSPHVPAVPIQQMPNVFPPGRPRLSEEEVTENRRLRILYAAARLAEEKGYTATTVADITKLARVDGRLFYRLFADKQEAFAAVHELGFQQVMDVTAKAFFAGEGWPARSWEAGRALTQLLEANPVVAHVGFVEAYAVGPGAVQRIEDSHTAFMFFLQEGLLLAPDSATPSRTAMEAVIDAVFEVIYLRARAGKKPQIAAMLGLIAHLWLAPFLGVDEADAFIDAQLRGPRAGKPASSAGAAASTHKRSA